jgi:hypothetical protein
MPIHHWNPFGAERRLERKHSLIGFMMGVGLFLFLVVGFFVYILAFGAGIDRPVVDAFNLLKFIPVIGFFMYVGGLFYGIYSEKTEHQGLRKTIPNCRVIARYAITRDHRLVTDESEFEFLDRPNYYVKLLSPNDGSIEYKCQPPVYFACGEGMIGEAQVQGNWLGSFKPYMGMTETHVGQKF